MREGGDLAGGTTEAMIGHCASEREPILHDIEAVDVVFCGAHPPTRSKCPSGCKVALTAIQKIAVEGEDHIGVIKARDQPRVRAEGDLGGIVHRVPQERLVNAPAQIWRNPF